MQHPPGCRLELLRQRRAATMESEMGLAQWTKAKGGSSRTGAPHTWVHSKTFHPTHPHRQHRAPSYPGACVVDTWHVGGICTGIACAAGCRYKYYRWGWGEVTHGALLVGPTHMHIQWCQREDPRGNQSRGGWLDCRVKRCQRRIEDVQGLRV